MRFRSAIPPFANWLLLSVGTVFLANLNIKLLCPHSLPSTNARLMADNSPLWNETLEIKSITGLLLPLL